MQYCLTTLFTLFALALSAQELDVEGDGGNTFALRNMSGVTSTIWQSFYPTAGESYKAFIQSRSSGQFDIGAVGGDIHFYSGSSYKLFLKTDGTLGLGTSTPDGKFEIVHNSSSGSSGVPHLDLHESSTNDFARLKFTNSGSNFWTLAGAGGSTNKFNIFYSNGSTGSNRLSVDATEGTTILGAENTGTIAALKVKSGIQNMLLDGNEIDSDGNIHLNFNSQFDVNLRTNADRADVNMKHQSSSGAIYGFAIENEGTNNNWWTLYTVNANGDLELYYEGTKVGDFDSASGAYTATSDRNRKKDIRPFENVLSRVMNTKPSVYKFNGDSTNKDYLGFIAQEIEQYFPEIVKKGTVGDTEEELYTMDYSALGVIAIEAVKEQQLLIEAQAEEIADLKTILLEVNNRLLQLEK